MICCQSPEGSTVAAIMEFVLSALVLYNAAILIASSLCYARRSKITKMLKRYMR